MQNQAIILHYFANSFYLISYNSDMKFQNNADNQTHLDNLASLIKDYPEGITETEIPYLSVIRGNRQTTFEPGVITPSFCVIVRGHKRAYIGEEILEYSDGDTLSSLIALPATGMIVGATPQNPYLGLKIELSLHEIASVITEAGLKFDQTNNSPRVGVFLGKASREILELFLKMVQMTQNPQEIYLSKLLKKEMIFRLLTGEYGHFFFKKPCLTRIPTVSVA